MFFRPSRLIVALMSVALLTPLVPALVHAQSAPTVTGYTELPTSTTLTISGQNFGTSAGMVRIDNSPVTITSWSENSIAVGLPTTDGPGTMSITTNTGLVTTTAFNGVERGYYTLNQDGAVTAENGALSYGDLTTIGAASSPAVQLVPTQDNGGYWILTQNGSVYAFGDAANFGALSSPITAVSMAVLPSGLGAYVLASDGTVYPLGQAKSYGSPAHPIPAQSLAVTSNGLGYWILGQGGMVYPYGDAKRYPAPTAAGSSPFVSQASSNGSLVKVSRSGSVFLVEHGVLYHIPNLSLLQSMGDRISQVRTVSSLSHYPLGTPLVIPYPDGTLLKSASQSTLYLVKQGVLHPVTSGGYQALGLTARQVVQVPSIKANWPVGPAIAVAAPVYPDGTLYKAVGPTVYIVNQNALHAIASGAIFRAMGLRPNTIHHVSSLPPLPVGTAISTPVLIPVNGTLWRPENSPAVYLAQNGTFRQFPTAALFRQLGFSMGDVHEVPSLTGLRVGAELGSTAIPLGTSPAGGTSPSSAAAVDLVPTADNNGYWILDQNGEVVSYGDAQTLPQVPAADLATSTAISLAVTPDGAGDAIVLSTGQVLTLGDAQPTTGEPGVVEVAMIAGKPAPLSFASFAYGSFMPFNDGSYGTLKNYPTALSGIVPTWYYLSQNPRSLAWTIGRPPAKSGAVVTQAHSENVQVWPMFGTVSVGPYQTEPHIKATVTQIVQAAVANHYDGVTIDFEPGYYNGLTMGQVSRQYTNFVSQLGAKLHDVGKKLMVDVYPYGYPSSPFNFAAIADNVDYINIMSYGEFDSLTEAGPTQGLGWDQNVMQTALAQGVPASKIIMGMGPFGDYWSFNNSGLDKNAPLGNDSYVSDTQAAQLLKINPAIVPIWDPVSGSEVFMTNQYLDAQGHWTVNLHGSAVAPTKRLSIANPTSAPEQTTNLEGLLNYILLRYAVENNQPIPSYLNLAQDGRYNSVTQEAVTQFQQDFAVVGATPGVYDTATKAALQRVIQQWNIGEYQYWIDNTQSMQNRIQTVALPDHLGGAAIWRTPFETNDYWPMLTTTANINPAGN